MELDRRITLSIREPDTRNMYGERVEGVLTEYPVWARFTDAGTDNLETGGVLYAIRGANFRVRWLDDLIGVPVTRVGITDENGITYNVGRIREVPMDSRIGRKRFIELDVSAEVY